MNIERLNILADYIEKQMPETRVFNMAVFGDFVRSDDHPCKTAACIGGHAVMLFGDAPDGWTKPDSLPAAMSRVEAWVGDPGGAKCIGELAADLLGLKPAAAAGLFLPHGIFLPDITPSDAARTLRHLARTGRVDWSDFPGWWP